ncbi:MAG: Maf family protein [Eubacterium sp.]|nr:Maf family protein [Eubacterium sp.]
MQLYHGVNIVLASTSPRRHEILDMMGIPHVVVPSESDEYNREIFPDQMVEELSRRKCSAVYQRILKENTYGEDPFLVIGADTVVAKDGVIFGKPSNKENAYRMLSKLANGTHQVYTGVTILGNLGAVRINRTCSEKSEVHVSPMEYSEIWEYIETGDPMDKAGSYGIQGFFSRYIDGIKGDYFNIVGLPAHRVYRELKEILG